MLTTFVNSRSAPIAAMLLCAAALGQDYFIPVNLIGVANDRLQNRDPVFPSGSLILGGVPFFIEPGGNNIWWAGLATGPNPRTLTVPVNVRGVKRVETLINTAWGQGGPGSLLRIEFIGTHGAFHALDLVGGVDVRDWNQYAYTNTINNTTTTNVFVSGGHRLDKQSFELPDSFANEDLLAVRVVDTGAENVQRGYLQGLTVRIDQPPPRLWLPAFGGNCNSYTAIQTPQGINWQDASDAAAAIGGHLATIASAEENAFAYSLVGGNAAFWFIDQANNGLGPWLGGRQAPGSVEPAGGWGWVDGSPFTYANWASGEPNNSNGGIEDRLQFFGGQVLRGSSWNDLPGSFTVRGFVVEFDRCVGDYNGDGGIDGTDVQAFFSEWESASGCADVNDDGGIDGSDVQTFFDRWEAGAC
ncbi:MAG: hypothetical protein JSR77_08585 [Planctomycetes bacterium]|nr:hypothetical protein [Planctomycetota bacterium]